MSPDAKKNKNIFSDGIDIKPGSSSVTHLKYMFVTGIILGTAFLFLTFNTSRDILFPFHYKKYYYIRAYNNNATKSGEEKFTIRTEGCSIPALLPLDESILQYVKYPENLPLCFNSTPVLERNKTHIWITASQQSNGDVSWKCCYRLFYRPMNIEDVDQKVDNRVAYGKCIYFSDIVGVDNEFVKVNCSTPDNKTFEEFFIFATKKKFKEHDSKELESNLGTYNVLVLGIDSVSRLNFIRTMPKTVNFLRSRGAVDFMGYNKVGDNTFPNLIPMLMGISAEEIKTTCLPHSSAKFDNCPFIWEWFKQAGYYTAFGEDSSWLGTFNYLRAGFINTPTDYYVHTFVNEAEKYASSDNSSKLCLNDKFFYKVLLDYVRDLTYTLKSSRLFGFFWETTISHDYLNYPMIMDNDYVDFFQILESSGYLNETIILLVSDHGIRWGEIRYTKQGRIEERLPFIFLLTPPKFRRKYKEAYKNLELNSKRLTTPYDVHATLRDMLNFKNIKNRNIISRSRQSYSNNRGISLFLPIPGNRTCRIAAISDHWCTCHKSKFIPNETKEALIASSQLIEYLNLIVKNYKQCADLKLADVIEVNEMLEGTPDKEETNSWREFMVVIHTVPGDGIFEATLRNHVNEWFVLGTVSRLNLYGNQSHCVEDNQLKLYCYCLE